MSDEDENEQKPAGVVPAADTEPGPASVGASLPESDPLMYKSFPPPEPKPVGAISSGAFEISRASFSEVPAEPPHVLPPAAGIANADGGNQQKLSLRAIVGISAGVLVLAVGLALLLFR